MINSHPLLAALRGSEVLVGVNVKVRTGDAGSDVTPLVITRVVAGLGSSWKELSATLREMDRLEGNQEQRR